MVDIDNDGDVDVFIGSLDGSVVFVENTQGTTLDDVYVDFTASGNGNGAIDFPFNNLRDAVEVAAPEAIIHIAPGLSSETFTDVGAIATPLTLINTSGGTLRIGVSLRIAEIRGGFVSRSGKARRRR